MRKGWLIIPGVQDGDRTLEEQMRGVSPALAEAKGKTILDLGCAEGLLGREFVRSGAISCHGIDSVADHLKVAGEQCAGLPMTFQLGGLQEIALDQMVENKIKQYDIVLSLGVVHKLHNPEIGVRYSARSTKDLLLFRMHARSEGLGWIVRSKHRGWMTCNIKEVLEQEGMTLQQILPGPKEETVMWWRR